RKTTSRWRSGSDATSAPTTSASAHGSPAGSAGSGSGRASACRRWERAWLTTSRHSQPSGLPSPRYWRRLRIAVANASCTASRAAAGPPTIAAATVAKRSKSRRYTASIASRDAPRIQEYDARAPRKSLGQPLGEEREAQRVAPRRVPVAAVEQLEADDLV